MTFISPVPVKRPQTTLTRVESTDSAGHKLMTVTLSTGLVATLTEGCKKLDLVGGALPIRTFSEQKKLFTDNFTRTVSAGWGSSGGGGNYSVTGTASNYNVASGKGTILSPGTTAVNRFATITDGITSPIVRVKVTCDKAPQPGGGVVSGGIAFDYKTDGTGSDNHYRASITFGTTGAVSVGLTKVAATVSTTLATTVQVGSGFVAGDLWNLKVERTGSSIKVWAWLQGQDQTTLPQLTATDSTFTSGRVGCRAITNTGGIADTTVIFDELVLERGSYVSPPTITHGTWIRLLDKPYSGWNVDIGNRIKAWEYDLTPDILAVGMEYVANGTVAYVGNTSTQLKGQAFYGPFTASGGVDEGADFNDYMGITYTYPPSGGGTVDSPEAAEIHALDCSGLHRMQWGYRGGLPMARVTSEFYDGLNLPRQSKDMDSDGPGIVIASNESAAPSLTDLRIGDVLFWDATNGSDEESNESDHVGTYYGVDTSGNKRFISSRKTINGPTIGDLGGASIIDSVTNNLYTTRLRKIRRY